MEVNKFYSVFREKGFKTRNQNPRYFRSTYMKNFVVSF